MQLGVPFGGAKETGYGREHSIDTLKEWCRAKVISQPSGFGEIPTWRAVREVFG
jgi:acyl-CoA reductase-like NAD-dependent aldehyde dehydrogenase